MTDLVSVFRRVKPAVVAIAKRKGDAYDEQEIIGTGFNVDPRGLVVTAWHVVQPLLRSPNRADAALLAVEFIIPAGQNEITRFDVPVAWGIGFQGDVAILGLTPSSAAFPTLELTSGDDVNEGTTVGVCGYPLGLALEPGVQAVASTFQTGIVGAIVPYPTATGVDRKEFRLDIGVNQGNSGRPRVPT
jgi:S1-C subfamily serine protease